MGYHTLPNEVKNQCVVFFLLRRSFCLSLYACMAIVSSAMLLEGPTVFFCFFKLFSSISHDIGDIIRV